MYGDQFGEFVTKGSPERSTILELRSAKHKFLRKLATKLC